MSELPPELIARVLARDRYRCLSCGTYVEGSPHHYVFQSVGGGDEEENLVTLCWVCHEKVHQGLLGVKRIAGHFYFGDRT